MLAAAGAVIVMAVPAQAAPLPTARFVFADFGADQSWDVAKHPRVLADITGDGRADVVGFGDFGTMTAVATGDGGFGARGGVADFGFNQGWRIPIHERFVTDITGDGKADIVGVGNAGVFTSVSLGDGNFRPATFVLQAFGASTRPRLNDLIAADANNDGRTDLFMFTNGRVDVALARGDGTFAAPYLATTEFTTDRFDFNHFKVVNITGDARPEILSIRFLPGIAPLSTSPRVDGTYPLSRVSTNNGVNTSPFVIFDVADVTGDGRGDAVMPGQDTTTFVGTARGDGTFNTFTVAVNDFGYNNGAGYGTGTVPSASRADITADQRADLVGFNTFGVVSAVSLGNGTFAQSRHVVADFGFNRGWRTDRHPRLLADITGDGRADVVGFGNAGIYTAVSNGDGTFSGGPTITTVPDLTGDSKDEARSALQSAGLVLGTVTNDVDENCNNIDKVNGQNPGAGTQLLTGSTVNVTIGVLPPHPCP
ncbi:Repeat domain-containing protein [Lentzea waywayandensis]|uniref:Repeat domain-containing protein n=1 Tax=Lentzea waywayandensis TaxID=84724 RepID=A0A1I6FD11_9PSEU|nr:Repeat domain-containing protein [Lentzea waywayandensis]